MTPQENFETAQQVILRNTLETTLAHCKVVGEYAQLEKNSSDEALISLLPEGATLIAANKRNGFTAISYIEKDGTIRIVYNGTRLDGFVGNDKNKKQDARNNLAADLDIVRNGKASEFYKFAEDFNRQIQQELSNPDIQPFLEHAKRRNTIIFNGHSLGGHLAMLMAKNTDQNFFVLDPNNPVTIEAKVVDAPGFKKEAISQNNDRNVVNFTLEESKSTGISEVHAKSAAECGVSFVRVKSQKHKSTGIVSQLTNHMRQSFEDAIDDAVFEPFTPDSELDVTTVVKKIDTAITQFSQHIASTARRISEKATYQVPEKMQQVANTALAAAPIVWQGYQIASNPAGAFVSMVAPSASKTPNPSEVAQEASSFVSNLAKQRSETEVTTEIIQNAKGPMEHAMRKK